MLLRCLALAIAAPLLHAASAPPSFPRASPPLLHAASAPPRASPPLLSAASPPVRLVCSDVDGTLLTPSHRVTDRTVSTVLRAMDALGKHGFCACTGRGRVGAYTALGPIGERLRAERAPGVFLNGLVVYGPGDELVSEQLLPADVALEFAAFAAEHGEALVGFSGDRILCERRDEWTDLLVAYRDPTPEPSGPWRGIVGGAPIHKMILLAEAARVAALRPLLAERLGDAASITQAVPEMLEVLPAGGSKGAGVAALLERLGVDPSAVLALGDAENDIGMLELAGTACAMGHAAPAVKAAAAHVSATNAPGEDGGALAIERFVLGASPG